MHQTQLWKSPGYYLLLGGSQKNPRLQVSSVWVARPPLKTNFCIVSFLIYQPLHFARLESETVFSYPYLRRHQVTSFATLLSSWDQGYCLFIDATSSHTDRDELCYFCSLSGPESCLKEIQRTHFIWEVTAAVRIFSEMLSKGQVMASLSGSVPCFSY